MVAPSLSAKTSVVWTSRVSFVGRAMLEQSFETGVVDFQGEDVRLRRVEGAPHGFALAVDQRFNLRGRLVGLGGQRGITIEFRLAALRFDGADNGHDRRGHGGNQDQEFIDSHQQSPGKKKAAWGGAPRPPYTGP